MIPLIAAVLLTAASFSHADDFKLSRCTPQEGTRIFVYQNEQTNEVLGCFRIDKTSCEKTFESGSYPPKLLAAMQSDCRKAKGVGT